MSAGSVSSAHDSMQALSGPDGYSETPHDAAYAAALDDLTLVLIRAGAIHLHLTPPRNPMGVPGYERFRQIAAMAVAMVDSGLDTKIRLQIEVELTDVLHTSRCPDRLVRDALSLYHGRLMAAGKTAGGL